MMSKYNPSIHQMTIPRTKTLEAEIHCVARCQTHGVIVAALGEMTHCGPRVIFRVIHNHVSKGVRTIMAT